MGRSDMKYLRIIYVIWLDSETKDGWEAIENCEKLSLAHTVGVLVGETDEYLELAHSVDPENEACNGRIKIPHVAIKKARTLCQIQTTKKK